MLVRLIAAAKLQSLWYFGKEIVIFFATSMQKYAKKFTPMDFKVYLCSGFPKTTRTLLFLMFNNQ